MQAKALPPKTESHEALDLPGAIQFDSLAIVKGQRPIGFRFHQHIVNIDFQLGQRKLTASGEGDSLELAKTKARSELIERWALLSGPNGGQAETSNGWAAHPDKDQAQLNAIFELVERDAVLSQWYSATPLLRILNANLPMEIQKWIADELSLSEFPKLVVLISTKGIGPSVSCILKSAKGFGVSGHATRRTLKESIHSALAEACRAAHSTLRREYWGDTLKLKNGVCGLVDPGAHSVYYAYHEPFPTWVFVSERSWDETNAHWSARINTIIDQIGDFKFKTVLESPVCVGFVKHPSAFKLLWGCTSVEEVISSAGAKRIGLGSINKETHIVS